MEQGGRSVFGFSDEQIERYSRNLILKEVGGGGQRRLQDARVLVVGAGALGAPVALYLAAAGVGTIGIIDDDEVHLSNLQRQILHRTQDIGVAKVDSAHRALSDLNPDVRVKTYNMRLAADGVVDLINDYDLVVAGVDNFPSRYLVNDACVLANKPLVEAGILRWNGVVMTIQPGQGPCYRCVFPEPPPEGAVPGCQEAGVIGALAGVIGAIQALETIKVLLGVGESLTGRMLLFDGLATGFRQVTVRRNKQCPVCGDSPMITKLGEYDVTCEMRGNIGNGERDTASEELVTNSEPAGGDH